MAVPFGVFSFSKGEIAPGLFGRIDQTAFHTAATTFRNMFASFRGGAYSRAGTKFVGFSKQTGRPFPPRLVSFQFSILQGLALEFGNFYMRVVSNGEFVTEPPVPITGATNTNPAVISVTASTGGSAIPNDVGVVQSYAPGDNVALAGGTFSAPAILQITNTELKSLSVDASGIGYVPGDTIVPDGGTPTTPAQLTVLTTQVVSATVAAAGAGGTNGTQVVTGTTGTGTKFQATVTISGGAITAVLSVTLAGSYTVNPTVLAAEPVTGASLTGAQLAVTMGVGSVSVTGGGVFIDNPTAGTFTQASSSGGGTGATFIGALMAPATAIFITAGSYTVLPTNPVSQSGTSGIGLGATFNISWGASPAFAVGDWIAISGVDGMTELNGNTYVLGAVSAISVTLFDVYGNPVDATGFGAYLSGGIAARIFTLGTPWAEQDLKWLKWTQSADVMSLCCRNQESGTEYPPFDLGRIADDEWALVQTTFGSKIERPIDVTAAATVQPSTSTSPPIRPTAYAYVVTAVDDNGEESIASPIANIINGVDIAETAGSNIFVWASVAGANIYNVYKAPASYNTDPGNPNAALPVPAGALFGYVGSTYGTEFIDSNITADGAQVPPLHTDPFARGVIQSVTVTSFGSGVTTVTPTISTATGSGAVLQPVVVQSLAGGLMVAVIVENGGQNYASTDTIDFGGPGMNARGDIVFTLNPSNGDTITLDGVVWTFVTVSPGALQTQIQGSLSETLAQLVTDLAESGNGTLGFASYFATSTELQVVYGVPGAAGNLYTLAASAASPSGPALTGGGAGTAPQGFLVVGPQSGTYPSVVSYYQQRRVYAASANAPDTYEMSQPGKFTNFDRRIPTIDTDAITGTPWSLQVNGIQHFLSMPGGLLTFTGNQMWQLTGAGGSGLTPVAITPVDQQAQPQAFNGISATLGPIQVGYDVLFADAVGSYVYDVSYQYWLNIYTGNDITVFSSHLFDGFNLQEWAWARQPYKLVWGVRNDGAMLSLTFDKEQEVIGWTRHDTQGLFRSVCSVIEPPVNAPYFAVERFLGNPASPARFAPTRLPLIAGGASAEAVGISRDGFLTFGTAKDPGSVTQPVYWDANDIIHLLPLGGLSAALAFAASGNNATIVGTAQDGGGISHAVTWTGGPSWSLIDLGVLPGSIGATAAVISQPGTIVGGSSGTAPAPIFAVLWSTGTPAGLPFLVGGTKAAVTAMSADGTILFGHCNDGATAVHAVRWTGGPTWVIADLGFLPGDIGSTVTGCSADGAVAVGNSTHPSTSPQAVYWDAGGIHALASLPGQTFSEALASDGSGQNIFGVANGSASTAIAWQNTIPQRIPNPPGVSISEVLASSSDGTALAGFGQASDFVAIKWMFQPATTGSAYIIERMDNRLWTAAENCWCVDCALALSHSFPNATFSASSATGTGAISGVINLVVGQNYSALTTAQIIDDDGEGPGAGAVLSLTIASGSITAITPITAGTGYVRPAIVISDPSEQGFGASADAVLDNSSTIIATGAAIVFSGGDVGKVIRAGGGVMTVTGVFSPIEVIVNITSPILQVIPNSGGVPLPQLAGTWTMDVPVSTVSGLGHLANMVVTGLADGDVITPRAVSSDGSVTLDAPATQVIIGLGFQAQLQSPYLAEVAAQGQRKRIAEVTARVEASRGIRIGSNQPDASTLSPAPLVAQWSDLADAPDLGVPPYGSTTPPLYTGDVRIPIHGGYAKPGQAAVQQDFPLPLNILALVPQDDLGDSPQGGKPAAKPPQDQRRGFVFQPVGPTSPPYAR